MTVSQTVHTGSNPVEGANIGFNVSRCGAHKPSKGGERDSLVTVPPFMVNPHTRFLGVLQITVVRCV